MKSNILKGIVAFVVWSVLAFACINTAVYGADVPASGGTTFLLGDRAVDVSSNGETVVTYHVRVVTQSVGTNELPGITNVRKDVWPATTTLTTVVRFEYGTNTQFKLEITPDMSPGSWRSLVPGELKGVTVSPATNAVQWIEYWLDPATIGTPARMARIFTNYPQPPETNQPTSTLAVNAQSGT